MSSTASAGNVSPIPESGLTAARAWLDIQGLSLADLQSLPVPERAARLNQAVYAFCRHGPQENTLDELFVDCSTACGGYSYVLRGLLEATGVRTRYANLYNIPNQGNHTAVEVDLGTHWGFYDPTFGAYFTEDGTPTGRPLALTEIVLDTADAQLLDNVLQSEKTETAFLDEALPELYPLEFEHPYMFLENYQVAEAITIGDPRELLVLEIDLELENGEVEFGDFAAADFSEMSAAWLQITNARLLNDDLLDDISYNSSSLLTGTTNTMSLLTLSGLEPGASYDVSLQFWNPAGKAGDVQVSAIGKSVSLGAEPLLPVPAGKAIQTIRIVANEETGQLMLRNLGTVNRLHVFGVSAKRRS